MSEKIVTVSVTMRLEEKAGETFAMKKAMDAMTHYLNTIPRVQEPWVEKIEVK